MAVADTSVLAEPKAGTRRGLRLGGAVWAIAAMTVLALGVRVYLVTRSGFLTSGTVEYDDGVYLGASIRVLQGVLPYRDFSFVQPPGILILSLPAALTGRLISTSAGMVVARLLTMCASVACVPLAGLLVRHRGVLVTLVTCGFLALYPADILASRTLLLEPWMNLCCLIGANAAFRGGRLAEPRRLGWAGAVFGFAAAIKYWAVIPAVLLAGLCLIDRRPRRYLTGLVLGFVVPVAPFLLASPSGFVRGTVLDQIARAGTAIPAQMRLAYLTGLINVMNKYGTFTLASGSRSVFARASTGTTSSAGGGWVPVAVTVLGIVVLAVAYFGRPAQRSRLEWFALATTAASALAILAYSAFFYHYPDFTGPWLAIACGAVAGALPSGGRAAGGGLLRRAAAGVAVLAIVVATLVQVRDIHEVYVPPNPPAAGLIPMGACVVTDQVSLTIAADRFAAARPGCPDVVDSLAETLSLGHGTSVQGGAARLPDVVAAWKSVLGRGQYVWLTPGFQWRIPWPAELASWFSDRFRRVRTFAGYGGSMLYARDR